MRVVDTLSPSQMDAFNCSLAWYWGYIVGYQPVKKHIALDLGIGIHYALEKYYSERLKPEKVFAKWIDNEIASLECQWDDDVRELLEARTLGIAMLEGYVQHYEGKESFEVLATEQTMERELPNVDCKLVCRVDAVVRDKVLDKLFILEHKSFSRFEPAQLERDHQLCAQVWVAQTAFKTPISGVIYNGLRKQIPSPRIKLPLFERHYVYINKHQIAVFLKRACETYKQMTSPDRAIFPQPNAMRCNFCDFKVPCAAYCKGEDYKFILNHLFTKRKERHEDRKTS